MTTIEERSAYLNNPFLTQPIYGNYSPFYVTIGVCATILAVIFVLNIVLGCCSRHKDYWQDRHTGNRWLVSIWSATPHQQPPLDLTELKDVSVFQPFRVMPHIAYRILRYQSNKNIRTFSARFWASGIRCTRKGTPWLRSNTVSPPAAAFTGRVRRASQAREWHLKLHNGVPGDVSGRCAVGYVHCRCHHNLVAVRTDTVRRSSSCVARHQGVGGGKSIRSRYQLCLVGIERARKRFPSTFATKNMLILY